MLECIDEFGGKVSRSMVRHRFKLTNKANCKNAPKCCRAQFGRHFCQKVITLL